MKRLNALHDRLSRLLPALVAVFLLTQPVLDVLGYWQQQLKIPNLLTMAVRFGLLVGAVLTGFVLSARKRWYFLTAGLLAVVSLGHILACLPNYHDAIADLENLLRIFCLPLMCLCFVTFLRENPRTIDTALACCALDLAIIAAVMLLSTLTGTDPHTYSMEKFGVLGWFVWANSQSAILSMLAPLAIVWALRRWPDRLLPVLLVGLGAALPQFFLGTRLAFATMAATGVVMALACLLFARNRRKQALALALISVLLAVAWRWSPLMTRQQNAEAVDARNNQYLDELGLEYRSVNAETLADDPALHAEVERYYNHYIKAMVQHFGFDRVAARYNYSLAPEVLGSRRLERITFCEMLMEDAGLLPHLFGLNVMDMREFMVNGFVNLKTGEKVSGYMIFDVENDFHGIYFLTGWVGLALTAVCLLWIGLRALWRFLRDWKRCGSLDLAAFALCYGYGMIYALLTVSTLRRNNASVYFALALAGLLVLTDRNRPNAAEQQPD
ncbi:MAG: O-antigen ligase family protein [Oscillospiraceae bacterium]|nr:O-antigen ligase family protein [Oscillospiraceae bacterium]